MPSPLNPRLYQLLEDNFGKVKIASAGEAMISKSFRDPVNDYPKLAISHSGEYYRVCCFAGETAVATPAGDVPIRDLVGRATLLIPNSKGLGHWKEAEVRSFGHRRLLSVHLRRGRSTKTVRATKKHRWVLSGRIGLYHIATTDQLQPGDHLASCFGRTLRSYGSKVPQSSAIAVAQGFTFGDGSCPEGSRGPASVLLYGRKIAAMTLYFAACRSIETNTPSGVYPRIEDLPRTWKALPDSGESLSFLLGWLSGYFAADGHVSRSGNQATLYSHDQANLQFAKGVCYQLGIRVSPILPKRRTSEGCVPGATELPMFGMSFSVRDMPPEFWLLSHHGKRVKRWIDQHPEAPKSQWIVEDVEDLGESDEVFCAVVPDVEKFTLADNLLTMNCPFCNDTRHRLYVNHMYGQRDRFGREMTFLAVCYNETACMSLRENQIDFDERLTSIAGTLARIEIHKGAVVSEEAREIQWPGPCTRVDRLRDTHPLRVYLEHERHFDIDVLGRVYKVAYCHESHYYLAKNRMLIPVFERKKLKGWQARHIGELNWKNKAANNPPKYFTYPGMPRRKLLYNFDRARQYQTGVIVEGVTDVWGFGPMSVCTFGDSMSDEQLQNFLSVFRKRTAVLLYDPEAFDTKPVTRLIERLNARMPKCVAAVRLPVGTDPGSLDRDFLRDYVCDEADAQGVEICYDKVAAR